MTHCYLSLTIQEPDRRFTYCKDYNSASVVPVNEEAVKKAEEERSRGQWQTEGGFTYPGMPSSMESNVHSRKPDPARRDELKEVRLRLSFLI